MADVINDVHSEVYFINHDPVLGWIDENGKFFPCEYAEHEDRAKNIIQEKGWFNDWVATYLQYKITYGDYLCLKKRYVLIDRSTHLKKKDLYPICITGYKISKEQVKMLWNRYFATAPWKTKLYFIRDVEKWN